MNRRHVLKRLAGSSAALACAAPLASNLAGPALTETQSMISEGAAAMKDEVERLAKKVDQLDKRSKLMLKVLVIGLGLDLAADFLPISIHE
jgi:ubiquinone biosynthesis protein UbiJ